MNNQLTPKVLALCVASVLLSACGGGGGGGMVRSPAPSAPPPAPQPPPPVPTTTGPCQAPITGACVIVDNPNGASSPAQTATVFMGGGRDSAFRLQIDPKGALVIGGSTNFSTPLAPGIYRFAGGTTVSGTLQLSNNNTLISDVGISADGDFWNTGLVRGNIDNRGKFWLGGTVEGDVDNSGYFYVLSMSSSYTGFPANQNTIRGNMQQSAAGTLDVSVPTHGVPDYIYTLNITGQAHLAGTLLLRSPGDGWDAYPLPVMPTSALILHADGGVFGQFARWISPGLFIEGSLRYGSNDVWFDLKRISIAPAMASNGVSSALTLASANNVDRLLVRTDGWALMAPGALSDGQRRMLTSAGSVLRIDDVAQATRTLDSLSGAAHTDALQASLQRGVADAATRRRLAAIQPGFAAGAWSMTEASASTSGFDQWLSPRLLVGVQAGQGLDDARDSFGQSTRLAPQAGAYLRWFGDHGWYAGGSAGYAQHTLALDRTIDLGYGGQWNARARHRFNVAGVQGEAGRRLSLGGGTLTPYMALEATALRSERSIEQGSTGFELALQPALQAQLGTNLGLRYGRDWRIGDTGWLRLDADARVRRRLANDGDPLRAAYVGMQDLWFDVPGTTNATSGWLDLGLRGGFRRDWSWSLAHARPLAGPGTAQTWFLALQRGF